MMNSDDFLVASSYMSSQRYRHYHNIHHVADIIDHLHAWDESFLNLGMKDIERLYSAAVWHDYVYKVKPDRPGSNESDSAAAYTFLTSKPDPVVADIIRATSDHFSDTEYDTLTSIFLDLDLCTFSDDLVTFARAQSNIEAEYHTEYSWDEVVRGRYDFATKMLKPYGRFRVMKHLQPKMDERIAWTIERYKRMGRDLELHLDEKSC